MAHFATLLGKKDEEAAWEKRAAARQAAIDKYLWSAEKGLYEDYDFVAKRQSSYNYITTFYPLWAGLASKEQAKAVAGHLAMFEHEGGAAMSETASGVQWDLPFGWAPENWFAVSGLARYGYTEDAARVAGKFMATVRQNFLLDGTIREKYNVVSGSANVQVAAGYKSNVVGFGWTNGVYLMMNELLAQPATSAK
jgi:alpha,alpha-trehalase